MSCYSEAEIKEVVLDVIRQQPGIRTSDLICEVRVIMKPDKEDLEILNNRNDDKFSQKVRNIVSHRSMEYLVRTVGEKNRQWFLR